MQYMDEHIVFKDAENPLPEIKEQLQQMPFDDQTKYLAIYLSPISKEERDTAKHSVYYRVKEELLKYRISSQVIERDKVRKSNFRYSLPNIAVGILVKLDGIPCSLRHRPSENLLWE